MASACEGLPSGPCPDNRQDKSVKYGIYDLFLCPACEKTRDELASRVDKKGKSTKKQSKSSTAGQPVVAGSSTVKLHCDVTHADGAAGVTHDEAADTDRLRAGNPSSMPGGQQQTQSTRTCTLTSSSATAFNDVSAASSSVPNSTMAAPAAITIINELLAYALFYRDKSTSAELHKLIVGFYLPNEISESKRLLLHEFSTYLEDCQYKTVRRHSAARSAHDAEAEDILCMLDLLDNGDVLNNKIRFAAVSLDRVPMYGPNEINVCAVVDRQLAVDNQITELKQKFDNLNAFQADSTLTASTTAKLVDDQLKPVIDKIQDQLNTFISACDKLNESLKGTEGHNQGEQCSARCFLRSSSRQVHECCHHRSRRESQCYNLAGNYRKGAEPCSRFSG